MNVFKIKQTKNYYIHIDGYVFKLYSGKEIIIPIKVVKTVPKVLIENQNYNLVFLMVEYFGSKYIKYDEYSQYRFKYKIKNGKIPIQNIELIKFNSSKHNDFKMFTYKCLEKSISANSRVSNISTISESDVYDSLLRTNFRCYYCDRKLDIKTWELDHVLPLSKSGLNVSTNIMPSCKRCNRMKSNLDLIDFIHTCRLISENFKDSDFLNEKTFTLKKNIKKL